MIFESFPLLVSHVAATFLLHREKSSEKSSSNKHYNNFDQLLNKLKYFNIKNRLMELSRYNIIKTIGEDT